MSPPLSVIIPALDAAASLPATLAALREGRERGLVREVLMIDGGSRDGTAEVALRAGARVVATTQGRGNQLVVGAAAATGDWLLFLHADTRLGPGWADAVGGFTAAPANAARAGYLRYRLDDAASAARQLEMLVALRYRERTRIGEVSKSMGGAETVSYSQKDMTDSIKTLIEQYRIVAPIAGFLVPASTQTDVATLVAVA